MSVYQVTAEFDESLIDLLANSIIQGLSIHRNGQPAMCIELGMTRTDAAKCTCTGFQVGDRTIIGFPQDCAKDFTAKMLVKPIGNSLGRFKALYPKRLEIEILSVRNPWTFIIENRQYTVRCKDAIYEKEFLFLVDSR